MPSEHQSCSPPGYDERQVSKDCNLCQFVEDLLTVTLHMIDRVTDTIRSEQLKWTNHVHEHQQNPQLILLAQLLQPCVDVLWLEGVVPDAGPERLGDKTGRQQALRLALVSTS